MQENKRLREELGETNANYQELITTAKEVMRRKKLTQQKNEELTKQNKELLHLNFSLSIFYIHILLQVNFCYYIYFAYC